MANDPKVRILYDDFYKEVGVAAAWTQPAKIRVYRDALAKGRAKPTPRNSAADKAKLARVVSKAPEVMVKISGRTRDSGHLKEHMNYITRNGEVPAETEYGLMSGREAVGDVHSDWADDEIIYKGQHQVRKAPLSVNMVLSMPPGVDREAFRNAVRDFVDAELRPRVDVMLAFHDDTNHPHAHVTVRGRQHNGKTFNPGKPVLERYREQFAGALRNRGIEAEATPRYARGRTMKSDRQHMRHMRAKGLMPRTERAAIAEAFKDTQRAKTGVSGASRRDGQGRPRPWENAARERHAGVSGVYAAAAKELAASASHADRQLARKVEQFVQSMPAPAFAHDLYKQALERQIAERAKQPPTTEKKRDGPER
ncbi:relaxase/mobilization nuclease domain-containing protein [Ochrobactrum soli]|uniref:Type VI secretion protein n=1 Tax=Ochrobactrum soli TaxID=2448455 RepID=A0A849KN95_9HYPH|nr:type VI secretion protein [[Ochrobactrum] soli]NNU63365.1 type VI secretion protein [[Ochrobactrum] soli]